MSHHDTMDVLTGFAVIVAMVLFFATAGAWSSGGIRHGALPSILSVARSMPPAYIRRAYCIRGGGGARRGVG